MRNRNRWGQKLVNSGFRKTRAREVILDALSDTDKHLSAEDIYMKIHPEYPAIGLTTIYRTLDLLEQNGIIDKFDFGHGRAKFELSEEYSDKIHHHHLICKKCSKILDYSEFLDTEKVYIISTEKELEKKHGFTIDKHLIHFYGTCPECKKV